ncbi:MAG: 3-deoxy-7-phosphoheptulonate synthase [Bacteroidales bacterium]|nr:3-deoxy-7-phosphoheptulonate synthase [Bacteroidales bacterium]
MIIHVSKTHENKIQELAQFYDAFVLKKENEYILVGSSKIKKVEPLHEEYVSKLFVAETDMQLADVKYHPKREVKIGNISIGGTHRNTIVIAGPCSVESKDQIEQSSQLLLENGLTSLRGGAFKPRTSPYTFRGMGLDGLKLLDRMREKYGFTIVTEVRDSTHVDAIIQYADVIQIGAKAMYDHGILNRCGKTNKPILLKRGFGATLQEFVQTADFIMSAGNENVILCERGIRTFETKTRFTLDLCGVAYLKEYTNLPIILDPSHAMGYSYGVPDLARACVAMDIDGLLIETHPNPKVAKSDAAQQLTHDEFSKLIQSIKPVAEAVGRKIV